MEKGRLVPESKLGSVEEPSKVYQSASSDEGRGRTVHGGLEDGDFSPPAEELLSIR